jgi:hemolysin III
MRQHNQFITHSTNTPADLQAPGPELVGRHPGAVSREPVTDLLPPAAEEPPKPSLRGVSHHYAALVAAGAGIVLVAMAPTLTSAVAAAIYGLSLALLLGVSAVYHRPNWSSSARRWLRRADHASIYILIAGSYTPICLLALEPDVGRPLLQGAWIFAIAGVLKELFWIGAPKPVTAIVFLAMGWVSVPYFPEVHASVGGVGATLLAVGGLLYSLGAVVYALKQPNPAPLVFGYHEIFHALVVAASALHFGVMVQLVRRAGLA